MKKLFISLVFIGAFVSYVFYNNYATSTANASANTSVTAVTDSSASDVTVATPNTTTSAAPTSVSAPVTAPVPVKTPVTTPVVVTPAPVKKSTGQYIDGTYTGSVADAYYGNVQVRATVSGGKLTKVAFLQYPNDRGTSVSINRQAMPMLSSEAIQAQSANVSGVSGASDTSAAFKESLASALSTAKA